MPAWPPSAIVRVLPTVALASDSSHALQSLRLPASDRPTKTTISLFRRNGETNIAAALRHASRDHLRPLTTLGLT